MSLNFCQHALIYKKKKKKLPFPTFGYHKKKILLQKQKKKKVFKQKLK